jgi:hypothetical protein
VLAPGQGPVHTIHLADAQSVSLRIRRCAHGGGVARLCEIRRVGCRKSNKGGNAEITVDLASESVGGGGFDNDGRRAAAPTQSRCESTK